VHLGRRHRTRRRPTRRHRPDATGDPARPRGLRHRTNRLAITRLISDHVLTQPLRTKEIPVTAIHDPSLRAALKTLKPAALTRRVRRARFEQANTFEDFDCTVSPKLPAAMLCDPAALRWLDAGESVILYRPVGLGKIHVAQALGHQVSGRGGDIRFVKRSRMLADLADGHADRTIGQRMREYTYDHASIVARAVEHLRSRYRAEPDPDRLLGDGLPSTRCSVSRPSARWNHT